MPSSLKLHLLDLEVGLVSYKLWKSEDNISKLDLIMNEKLKE